MRWEIESRDQTNKNMMCQHSWFSTCGCISSTCDNLPSCFSQRPGLWAGVKLNDEGAIYDATSVTLFIIFIVKVAIAATLVGKDASICVQNKERRFASEVLTCNCINLDSFCLRMYITKHAANDHN